MHLFQWLSSYRHPSPLLIPFSQTLMETMQFIFFFFCKSVFIVSYNIHTLSLFVSISIASTFRRSQVFTVGLFSSTFSSFVRYTRIDCCTDIVNLSHKAIHRVVDWWIPLSSGGCVQGARKIAIHVSCFLLLNGNDQGLYSRLMQ